MMQQEMAIHRKFQQQTHVFKAAARSDSTGMFSSKSISFQSTNLDLVQTSKEKPASYQPEPLNDQERPH
jgi:putative lipoic acid-binding regulatory protein